MFAKLEEKHQFSQAFFDINMRHFQSMVRYHNISMNFLTALVSEKHLPDPTLNELHIWNYPTL